MPLPAGTRIGDYEILSLLGVGGMGEVYRARDSKLKREVALKVLPRLFAENPERLVRFQREAEVLASLNHPNIAHIYGVEDRALVMELVEGESPKGPLQFDEAWKIASQIADALEFAHERGVVHRDLKPANIKVTPEGVVKLLDFGLAKALSAPGTSAVANQENSPTLTMGATRAGVILGTAAYMAPEQAKGKTVDRRADIWAFGVVFYELLTGERLFQGEDMADTLAHVLTMQPDLEKAPAQARRLLAECLAKDPKNRLRDIGDAKRLLLSAVAAAEPPLAETRPSQRPWIPWALSAVLLLALAASLTWAFKPSPPLPITRSLFTQGEGQAVANNGALNLAISTDGTQMVYVADNRLYLRSMTELEARPIPGTDFAGGVGNPVFSPDGKSLAFAEVTGKTIKRIAVSGGAAVTILHWDNLGAMSWGEQGIVFSELGSELGKGIFRVSPNGGKAEPLVAAKDNELIVDPQVLPGGQAVLFTLLTSADWDKAQIAVQTLKSGARKILVEGGSYARYLPTGHLVYALGGVLYAVPFDLKRLETNGGPVGVVEGVARSTGTRMPQFAFSGTGSLVYRPGPVTIAAEGQNLLGFADRMGDIETLKLPPANYLAPRVSRDGKQIAYEIDDGKESSVWLYELSGATAPRRLTLPGSGSNRGPIWSADGQHIAFQSDREGDLGIWWQRADGSGAAERLTKPDEGSVDIPDSWAPDGQTFSFTKEKKSNESEVWTYSLKDKKATVFAAIAGALFGRSVFSPDGRWVAYQLRASPDSRVYVRPFPANATVYVAPADADSHHPAWSPDGKELFYTGQRIFGSMSFTTQPSVRFGAPVRVPKDFPTAAPSTVRDYDVLPDGKHFLLRVPRIWQAGAAATVPAGPPQIEVVLNWFEDVKQRVPGK